MILDNQVINSYNLRKYNHLSFRTSVNLSDLGVDIVDIYRDGVRSTQFRGEIKDFCAVVYYKGTESYAILVSPDGFKLDKYSNNLFSYNELLSIDFSGVDSSEVLTIEKMFSRSMSKRLEVKNLDTSHVVDFTGLFKDSLCEEIVHNLDVSNVKTFQEMYKGCKNLRYIDIEGEYGRRVNYISMFEGAESLEYLDLRCLNLSESRFYRDIIKDCKGLKKIDIDEPSKNLIFL